MEQLANVARAIGDFLAWAILQPAAAGIVGGFASGYAIGAAKNRTALVELIRGVVFGLAAGGIVRLLQAVIIGGGA